MAETKKAPVKVNENGQYINIAPETYADIVYSDDTRVGTVRTELDTLRSNLNTTTATANAAAVVVVSGTQPATPKPNMIWVKP